MTVTQSIAIQPMAKTGNLKEGVILPLFRSEAMSALGQKQTLQIFYL